MRTRMKKMEKKERCNGLTKAKQIRIPSVSWTERNYQTNELQSDSTVGWSSRFDNSSRAVEISDCDIYMRYACSNKIILYEHISLYIVLMIRIYSVFGFLFTVFVASIRTQIVRDHLAIILLYCISNNFF